MAVLITGNSFTTADQVTAATLNAATNSATFASGAVDGSTTQLSGGAIIVKDGGIGSAKLANSLTLITPNLGTPSAGILTNCTGTAAALTAGSVTTNANLTGAVTSIGNATTIAAGAVTASKLEASINVAAGIVTTNRLTKNIETGYASGGAITLDPDSKSLAYINLTSNPTFTFGTLSAGYEFKLILANNTVGTLTITWPAFVTGVGYTIPTSIVAGTTLVVDFISTGTTVGSVIATA